MAEIANADAVVVGAGMAGLVAAVDMAQRDIDVVVLEKAPEPGGSMRLSNGIVWTFLPFETLHERAPDGDRTLQRILVGRFENDLAWLAENGTTLSPVEFDVPGSGRQIDPERFTEHMVSRLESAGGRLEVETPFDSLVIEDGAVVGVEATSNSTDRLRIDCDAVVLATGGFQGNERLVEQHVTTATENLYLRSNPWSTGDGLLAALDVGAKSTRGLDTFYGHTMVAPPATVEPTDFAAATQYYGYAAVALNRRGERFTDESESDLEETLAQDVAQLADGRAYYVFDDTIADREFGVKSAAEIVANAEQLGGRTATVETLTSVGDVLTAWGADGKRAVETLQTYNRALRDDRSPRMPRRAERHILDSPPFFVAEVQSAITFTMGGIAVTPSMATKRRSASRSGLGETAASDDGSDTIPGLFAAGVDVGGFHRRGYVGGLAVGLVSGRLAAESVAERVVEAAD